MKRTLAQAAAAVGGRLVGPDAAFGPVSTDTRTLSAGDLFVALKGPHFDGGAFVEAAAARGAVGAMVERELPLSVPQIVVADALHALQRLARAWRAAFAAPVVAVGGSNGKTTTKEMTAAILARRGACLATRGNLNNHIGVPLTLMRLESSYASAVVEMGANRVGDVAELVRIAAPDVGLITNAGAEHLEGFGDLDGVARGEGEMVEGLGTSAVAVINADDAFAAYWKGVSTARRVLTFGVREPADFTARDTVQSIEHGEFATRFVLKSPQGEIPVSLHAGGAHNIVNALAAAAAASAAGATLTDIAAGLADFRTVAGRLQLKAGLRGAWIIDDSYNANPSSVRAGLDVLRDITGETWLVLGDMAELGDHATASHEDIGRYARSSGVAHLFATGPQTQRSVDTFGSGAEWFADAEALVARVLARLNSGVTVLVKGSRVNRLERVVQALTGGAA